MKTKIGNTIGKKHNLCRFFCIAAFLRRRYLLKQGDFPVGGTTIQQRPGTYDNRKFVGWAEQEETGQSYRADHAFVDYQIPADNKPLPA